MWVAGGTINLSAKKGGEMSTFQWHRGKCLLKIATLSFTTHCWAVQSLQWGAAPVDQRWRLGTTNRSGEWLALENLMVHHGSSVFWISMSKWQYGGYSPFSDTVSPLFNDFLGSSSGESWGSTRVVLCCWRQCSLFLILLDLVSGLW
jgi:hypothetical protein